MEEAGVRLVAEGATQFNNQLERAASAVNELGDKAGGIGSRGIDMMATATIGLGVALGNLAVQGLNAAASALTNFVVAGFDYNKSIENARAQLVAFTGSQEGANEALAIAERRAASTPFAFDEMAQSLASLAGTSRSTGADLEGLLGLAERLAASNPAEGLEGAAFALREAFSGDFMSLQERFNIGKADVARLKEMGVTVENLSTVLNDLGISTELVSGLAETFDGRMSSLNDAWTKLAGTLTDPIFDAISAQLGNLQPILAANMEQWLELAGNTGASVVTWAQELGNTWLPRLRDGWQQALDVVQTWKEAWAGDWVDSDIILPIHRLTGNLALQLKPAWDAVIQAGTWFMKIGQETGALISGTLVPFVQSLSNVFNALFNSNNEVNNAMRAANLLLLTFQQSVEGFLGNVAQGWNQFFKDAAFFIDVVASKIRLATEALNAFAMGIQALGGVGAAIDGAVGAAQGAVNSASEGAYNAGAAINQAVTGQTTAPVAPKGTGGTNKSTTIINAPINIPAGVSSATATKIVTDGIVQAQRARGMA